MTTEEKDRFLVRNAEMLAQMERLRRQLKGDLRAQLAQSPLVVAGGAARPGSIARVVPGKPAR